MALAKRLCHQLPAWRSFWTAPVLWRFRTWKALESARGLAQSKSFAKLATGGIIKMRLVRWHGECSNNVYGTYLLFSRFNPVAREAHPLLSARRLRTGGGCARRGPGSRGRWQGHHRTRLQD